MVTTVLFKAATWRIFFLPTPWMSFGIRTKLKCYDYSNVYAALLIREIHCCTYSRQVTDTIVVSTPPLSMFVRGKHPKPLLFAPINTTTTLNVYFNRISATYVLLSTSFSNKVWSFHGKEMDLAWIEASAAMKMRSALFQNTTAVIPEDRISRWITFMSGERGRHCR
jgi:hypothetical protein